MTVADTAPPPGNTQAKLLLLIFLLVASWMFVVFVFELVPSAAVPTAYGLPLIVGASLLLAVSLARVGTTPIPVALGSIGVFYIVGGGTLDMVATVIHSPSLHDETNPVGRALLDSGHPLWFVYSYAFVSQSLLLGLDCTLWLALLRHRDILTASLEDQPTLMRFVKAAAGGAHLTWRQWIFPLKFSELPRAYQLFWTLAVVLVAVVTDRWYLGLEWFDLVPSIRWFVAGIAVIGGLVAYFVWLWCASRHRTDETQL